ncbi:MAG: T9SS type A sorting domain-containing protein [Flavobacteriales bacterium]|nr:T9SS type A sorting domain-containing protein [Flavobacteriales bacterium]
MPAENCGYTYDSTDYIRIGNDTLISDTVYTTLWRYQECEVYQTGQPNYPWCTSSYFTVPTHLYAMLRQDTNARTVHLRLSGFPSEALLYDFNMQVGPYPDTYNSGWGTEVVSIDSVLLTDGYHKRFTLNVTNWNGPGVVIEGVGSNFGLMTWMVSPFENHDRLLCFGTNGAPIFVAEGEEPLWVCNFTAGVTNTAVQPLRTMRSWPNPASSMLHVELSGTSTLPCDLLNSSGRRVHSFTLKPGHNTVELEKLSAGLYLLLGTDGTAVRIVKE